MILRYFLTIALALAALGPGPLRAAPKAPAPDDALIAAHEAFRAGDALRLAKAAAFLQGHVLAPYAEYWALTLRLEDAAAREVEAFRERHAGSYLAERLHLAWLKELGRRGDWPAFEREFAGLRDDDLELRCYGWSARLARGDDSAYAETEAVWREPRDLPAGCDRLAARLVADARPGVEALWDRVQLLLENGKLAAAKRTLAYLPKGEYHDERLLQLAASSPQRLLARPPANLERRATREMLRFAFVRLARTDPRPAAEILKGSRAEAFGDAERRALWGRIAYEGARRHIADALDWYREAEGAPLNDDHLAWKARAALRAGDWSLVREAIDAMSRAAHRDPAWTYWYARALQAQGSAEGARAYFLKIAGDPHFYGMLAAEELGEGLSIPEPFHTASEAEVAAIGRHPGLVRALALYRLELRSEATREWNFSLRGMDDAQLLAAAELARRAEVFDRAINTADRTTHRHNFQVRYLAPFREVFSAQARAFELEEAWVLGLVRQESRFIVKAKSSVGAQGLMQLMPATARWVAKRNGMQHFSQGRVAEVPINVALGTSYLRLVLDDLGHALLASAAYNAGPGRARRWRDVRPLEGAIYAETIPFNETRDYVKKVMANTMYYSQLIGGKLIPLKDRLGQIPAKSSAERVNEELP